MKKQLTKKRENEIIKNVFKESSKEELIETIMDMREIVETYIRELHSIRKILKKIKKYD